MGSRTGSRSQDNDARGMWVLVARLPRKWLLPIGLSFAALLALAVSVGQHHPSFSPNMPASSESTLGEEDLAEAHAPPGEAAMGGRADAVRLVSHVVQEGDTLWSIAEMFDTSVDSIAHINGLLSPDMISVGQELSLLANGSGTVVRVSSGDTLSGFAADYDIPVDAIVSANRLADPDKLQVGQALILPGARLAGRPIRGTSRLSALRWPVRGTVTSGFGWRTHPVTRTREFHRGIDVAAPGGTQVVAAAAGRVSILGWNGGYGRLIIIDHGNGIETRYGHLSSYAVQKGQRVSAGQVIGYVGSSGLSTGPHLHFEVRIDGEAVNPKSSLP